jgi:hypothetical protein
LVTKLDARSATKDVIEEREEREGAPIPSAGKPLVVRLDVKSAACVGVPATESSQARCKPFEAESDDAAKARIESGVDSNIGIGVVFEEFPGVVETALRWHLARKFNPVSIETTGAPAADTVVVKAALEMTFLPEDVRHAEALLTARLRDGTEVQGKGVGEDKMSSAHLGWAIPLIIIFFPISLTFVPPSYDAVSSGKSEHAIAIAIDVAAKDLAGKLADRLADGSR